MPIKHLSIGSVRPPLVPGNLRLYSMRFCPYAQRIHLILDIKRIPYDVVYINLKLKPEWFTEVNPFKKVPCIELANGQTLNESLIIADYLNEAYPGITLYPSDPLAKANDKLLIDRFNDVIKIIYKILAYIYQMDSSGEEMFEEFLTSLKIYEQELEKRQTPFFGGSTPGMLDLMIWPWCERMDVLRIREERFTLPQERFPRLLEWQDIMKEEPSVQISYLDARSHVKYILSHLAGTPQFDL